MLEFIRCVWKLVRKRPEEKSEYFTLGDKTYRVVATDKVGTGNGKTANGTSQQA